MNTTHSSPLLYSRVVSIKWSALAALLFLSSQLVYAADPVEYSIAWYTNKPTPSLTDKLLIQSGDYYNHVTVDQLSANLTAGTNAFARVLNVKLPPFNAVGNGTNDDSAAIQSALWYAAQSNGYPTTVYIPAGNYLFTNHVQLPPNPPVVTRSTQDHKKSYSIIGDGNGSRILWTNNAGEAFYAYNPESDSSWGGGTGWVSRVFMSKFYIQGPWKGNPDRSDFDSDADGSTITAAGIRVGCTNYDAGATYPAMGELWRIQDVYIKGFADGIVMSNINWPTIDGCTIEWNTKRSILMAGIIKPIISHCALGTLINTAWTNDIAAIDFASDSHGNAGDGSAIIIGGLCGYNNTFIHCTNGRSIHVNGQGAEGMYRNFAKLSAVGNSVYITGVDYVTAGHNGPFILLDGSYGDDMSGFVLEANKVEATCPLVIATNWGNSFVNHARLPKLIVPRNYKTQYTYWNQDNNELPLPLNSLFGFVYGGVTNYVYVPEVGEPINANIVGKLGTEKGCNIWSGTSSNVPGLTTIGSYTGAGWWKITGTPGSPAACALYYSLPMNQSSRVYSFRLSAISSSASVLNCNFGVATLGVTNSFTQETGGQGNFTFGPDFMFCTNKQFTCSTETFGNKGQTFHLYFSGVTNTVYLTDIQVELNAPYYAPTTNAGWRLPNRY